MKHLRTCTLALLLCLLLGGQPRAAEAAPAYSAAQLIAEVNALRAANGLPLYQIDSTLTAIAQAHSDYQASIGTVTHDGPGGSRPRARAIAAGYGAGATIFVTENIAGGHNLTAATAVQWWQGDAPHLNTMLGAQYTDVGAGAATSANGRVYYTLDVGYVSGAPGTGDTGDTPPDNPAPTNAPAPSSGTGASPVVAATPQPDGAIIHTVQAGQALYTIAVIYDIPLDELLTLNGMNENSVIFPGNEILIRPADTVTETATLTQTETAPVQTAASDPAAAPSRTPRPTRTPLPSPTATPPAAAAPTAPPGEQQPAPPPSDPATSFFDTVRWLLVALVLMAGALAMLGSVRERKTGDR